MCMKIRHSEGRFLAPADNSPAHWLMIQVFGDVEPSLDFIARNINEIPMTQRMSAREAAECDFKKTLEMFDHCGTADWYLAHRTLVGLGRIGDLRSAPLNKLREHFRKFMSPLNMSLVAKRLSGLAELEFFFEADAGDTNG